MNREQLVKSRGRQWKRLETLLGRVDHKGGPNKLPPAEVSELARIYRSLAADLMLVRRDRLGPDLERHLDVLASRSHNALYRGRAATQSSFFALLLDFPGAVRRNVRFFALAFLLFYGSGFLAGTAAYYSESYSSSILGTAGVEQLERSYEKEHRGRDSDSDASMTGFYVMNNVGIAFTCFATGIFFAIGPILYLLFNGIHIGVAFGHLFRVGYGANIVTFTATHSPWELTAIVISAAAGMQMGWALVKTNGRTRLGSLQSRGLELLRQVAGAAAFLFLAALLEAWYSPSSLPAAVKWGSGAVGWVLVLFILSLAGRSRPIPSDVSALESDH